MLQICLHNRSMHTNTNKRLRIKRTLLTTAGVALMALTMSAAHLLDAAPVDHSAEWAESESLQELQASEAGTARRELAAQALCNEERGPNSEARWLPDGSLVCTTRRGLVGASL
jgi:hypothetical protein